MHVFISTRFEPGFSQVSQCIRDVAAEGGLSAYRVDQEHIAEPIAQAIDRKIRESRLAVADITGNNSNGNRSAICNARGRNLGVKLGQLAPWSLPWYVGPQEARDGENTRRSHPRGAARGTG